MLVPGVYISRRLLCDLYQLILFRVHVELDVSWVFMYLVSCLDCMSMIVKSVRPASSATALMTNMWTWYNSDNTFNVHTRTIIS